jgi:hypothetical protein
MPGGQGLGEGVKELAAFFMFVLLLVFFALAIRTEWDRRQGKAAPWGEVLEQRRRQGRGFVMPKRQVQQGPREGDVI